MASRKLLNDALSSSSPVWNSVICWGYDRVYVSGSEMVDQVTTLHKTWTE